METWCYGQRFATDRAKLSSQRTAHSRGTGQCQSLCRALLKLCSSMLLHGFVDIAFPNRKIASNSSEKCPSTFKRRMSGHGGIAELEATPLSASPISSTGARAQGFAGESSAWLFSVPELCDLWRRACKASPLLGMSGHSHQPR